MASAVTVVLATVQVVRPLPRRHTGSPQAQESIPQGPTKERLSADLIVSGKSRQLAGEVDLVADRHVPLSPGC